MGKTNENPASGGTLGGAGNFDLAGSGSSVPNKHSKKRRQRPSAPKFVLRRLNVLHWVVKFADGREIWLDTNLIHAQSSFRREVKLALNIDYPKISRGRWFEILHYAIEGGGS
jgi:hypothetical protein